MGLIKINFIGKFMQNIPECSIQRRHYLSLHQNSTTVDTSNDNGYKFVVGVFLLIMLVAII